ncbi:MAG: DUF1622 domain-containing protein [Syntrophotaleaceae bacterium]
METLDRWIEFGAMGVEVLAVIIMMSVILIGTVQWLAHPDRQVRQDYWRYRFRIGKALLLGLELLVAADIIRTVVVEPTLVNMAVLGALVVVRTFLGWSLSVEIEGHWPWQGNGKAREQKGTGEAAAEPTAGDRKG